ncbi:TPA: phytoene desaturase [Candidatus Poribacteria bacterium]|nr:phytoene desaturase [Candidatus Poribacteria bacterium]
MGKKVIVIGGGLGALSGAIRLAKMGFRVQLFEQNEKLGGKMSEFISGQYRFDTGPSLLTMDFVVDDLFNFAGFDRPNLLKFIPIDPICRYFFPDGSVMDTSSNIEKMINAINDLSPFDAGSYKKYLKYCERIYNLTADIFLFTPIHEIKKVIKKGNPSILFKLYQMDPFHSFHQGVSKFFSDPRLIQLFDRYATYNGSDPFQAPATLNIISYVEYGLGAYYIKGGMYRLVNAMEEIAKKMGIEILKSTKVEKILWSDKEVKGVVVNNEKILSDYVLCGSDVVTAYNSLIDGFHNHRKKLNNFEPSLSGMVFLWGINKKNPELKHHNIIFSSDYKKEFRQIFKELKVPDEPTIYISITSKTDPEHASINGENWFVLVNVPYLSNGQDDQFWNNEIDRMRSVIFNRLKGIGIDISSNIEVEKIITPLDFLRNYASNRGSIYGISSNNMSMAFKRPANRSRDIKGLYFAGGSVHPGGGIPLVMLSGKMSAELINESEKMEK